jgi:hypothetical protein
MNERNAILRKKIDGYFLLSIPVHIKRYFAGWLNGIIIKVSDNSFLLDERKVGIMKEEIPFDEVEAITKYEGDYYGLR